MKKVGCAVFISAVVVVGLFAFVILYTVTPVSLLIPSPTQMVSGKVLDCDTQMPLSGVHVMTARHRWGAGETGYLVWDKRIESIATTDRSGNFELEYKGFGKDFKLTASKEAYFDAEHFGRINGPITVKLLTENDMSRGPTYDCIPIDECLKTTLENSVEVTRNICKTT